jgi:hypothetical protein
MPPSKTLLQRASQWNPAPEDRRGPDKKKFLNYLIAHCKGKKNATNIERILNSVSFQRSYSKGEFQHSIIVPLREDENVFIGTSNKGIYLVTDAEAAYTTIGFYTNRIRSERKHLRNLTRLAARTGIFTDYDFPPSPNKRKYIYFDETGSPTLTDVDRDPFFIVTAVVISDRKSEKLLERKFKLIRETYGKAENFEMKSSSFDKKKYKFILQELSTLDYEFCYVCFLKRELVGPGFEYPKSFYKYAYSFLLDRVIESVVAGSLFFDEYSSHESPFNSEFIEYIAKHNAFIKKDQMKIEDSRDRPGIQLADLLCGVVRNRMEGNFDLFPLVQDKLTDFANFPDQ